MRTDAGRDTTGRINGDRKIRPIHFPVLRDHALQPKLFGRLS